MSMISCPECSAEVSDKAFKCPSCGVQIKAPKRGFFGKIFKWGFILFNLIMIAWLVSYWGLIGDAVETAGSEAERAGTAIGATIGSGLLFGIWAVGDIILGIMVLFTRPKT